MHVSKKTVQNVQNVVTKRPLSMEKEDTVASPVHIHLDHTQRKVKQIAGI